MNKTRNKDQQSTDTMTSQKNLLAIQIQTVKFSILNNITNSTV